MQGREYDSYEQEMDARDLAAQERADMRRDAQRDYPEDRRPRRRRRRKPSRDFTGMYGAKR